MIYRFKHLHKGERVNTCLDRLFLSHYINLYFPAINLAVHQLWQLETRHTNAQNICAFLMYFLF